MKTIAIAVQVRPYHHHRNQKCALLCSLLHSHWPPHLPLHLPLHNRHRCGNGNLHRVETFLGGAQGGRVASRHSPASGVEHEIGKPEPLKYFGGNVWSRRINDASTTRIVWPTKCSTTASNSCKRATTTVEGVLPNARVLLQRIAIGCRQRAERTANSEERTRQHSLKALPAATQG